MRLSLGRRALTDLEPHEARESAPHGGSPPSGSVVIYVPSPKLPSLSSTAGSASLDMPDTNSSSESMLVLAAVRGVVGRITLPRRLLGHRVPDGSSADSLAFLFFPLEPDVVSD